MSAAAAVAAEAPAKKSGRKKLILIGAAVLLLLAVAGAGTVVVLQRRAAAAAAAAEDEAVPAGAVAQPEKKVDRKHPPVFVPMDNFVVNLADREADRYAQIGVTLEVPDEKAGEDIKTYLPAIRNNILLLLAHKTSTDLAGGEGKQLLAREIRREALKAMGVEVDDDEAAPAASGAASAARARARKKAEDAPEPQIRSVQFSSFIIQ